MEVESEEGRPSSGLATVPRGIWILGFVSMFMDMSSEMIHALLPAFLASVLGASVATIGVIEGVAEATASITKVFSGTLSDRFGNRKLLASVGYGLAALTKPVFALAPTVGWVATARFADRVGKGIRGAPRDALVADIAPEKARGASYGLRQSLDTIGAFAGPLLAVLLMWLTGDRYRLVFWLAVIPAILSFALIAFGVREPRRAAGQINAKAIRPRLDLSGLRMLGRTTWTVVLVGGLFSLARFSEAFLILRVQSVGLAVTFVPLTLVVMNVAYALSAYPVGALSDRVGRIGLLAIGLVFLIVADGLLAVSQTVPLMMIGVVFWGLHMGFSQGLLAALVADASPAHLRGTAFGIFNLVTGLALLVASALAGGLWVASGPAETFLTGACLALASLVCLVPLRRNSGETGRYDG